MWPSLYSCNKLLTATPTPLQLVVGRYDSASAVLQPFGVLFGLGLVWEWLACSTTLENFPNGPTNQTFDDKHVHETRNQKRKVTITRHIIAHKQCREETVEEQLQ